MDREAEDTASIEEPGTDFVSEEDPLPETEASSSTA